LLLRVEAGDGGEDAAVVVTVISVASAARRMVASLE